MTSRPSNGSEPRVGDPPNGDVANLFFEHVSVRQVADEKWRESARYENRRLALALKVREPKERGKERADK